MQGHTAHLFQLSKISLRLTSKFFITATGKRDAINKTALRTQVVCCCNTSFLLDVISEQNTLLVVNNSEVSFLIKFSYNFLIFGQLAVY